MKENKEELGNKIRIIENENNVCKIQLEQNNEEINSIKNKIKQKENLSMKFPYKKIIKLLRP